MQSFLSYASQPSGASILCFHTLSPLGLTLRSDCNLVALRSQVFFPFLSVLRAHQMRGLVSLMMVTSWVTDMAGSTSYLIPKLSFPRAHVVSCVDTDIDIPSMER